MPADPRRKLTWLLLLTTATLAACDRGPRRQLVEVPEPVLEAVEPAVREQILAAQQLADEAGTANQATAADAFGALARTYHAYEFLAAADAAYTNARHLDPESFRWAYLQGALREAQGRYEEAIEALDAALALDPGDLTARVRRASIRRELGDVERSRRELEEIAAEREDVALAHYLLGQMAADRGDLHQAAERFERVLELQPHASRVRYPLSRVYARLGRVEDAEREAGRSGNADVTLPDARLAELAELKQGPASWVRRGALAQIAGDWHAAIAAYRQAVAADPEHLEARMSLGGALVELGDLEAAEEQLRRAVEIDAGQAMAWYNLAGVLRGQRRFAEALAAYDEAIGRHPGDPRFHLAKAQTEIDAGTPDTARITYRALADAGGTAATEAELGLARLDIAEGDRAVAIRRLEALLDSDLAAEQRRLTHLLLADAKAHEGDAEAALHHYDSVIRSVEGESDNDRSPPAGTRRQLLDALFGRANLLGTLGRYRDAMDSYDRVAQLAPPRAEAWLGGATAAALQGDWSGARQRLEQGLVQVPDQVDLSHTLARLLATAPSAGVRDGERALSLARAVLGDGGSVDSAETVGMALAELERWQEAIDWQTRVLGQLEAAGETQRAAAARTLLDQYRRRQPVRQGTP